MGCVVFLTGDVFACASRVSDRPDHPTIQTQVSERDPLFSFLPSPLVLQPISRAFLRSISLCLSSPLPIEQRGKQRDRAERIVRSFAKRLEVPDPVCPQNEGYSKVWVVRSFQDVEQLATSWGIPPNIDH